MRSRAKSDAHRLGGRDEPAQTTVCFFPFTIFMSTLQDDKKEKMLARLKEYLTQQWRGPELRTAYLFGSTATGHGWKTIQDVDVAVVFAAGYRLENGERLKEELERLLDSAVDVVVLNESPPLLWYEVLLNGQLIWCADESERVEHEVRSLMQYYDLEPQRQRLANDIRTMIQEGLF